MKKSFLSLTVTALATLAGVVAAHADTHTWSGAAITPNWSTPANWAGNNPPYAGEPAPVYIIFPAGAARQANYCNIANLVVDRISFTGGGYDIQSAAPGTAITLNNAFQAIFCSETNNILNVPLVLGATNLNFIIGEGDYLTLANTLSGPGSFQKLGRGDLWISGVGDNTFTGRTTVLGGTLHLNKIGGYAFGGALVIGDTNGPAYQNAVYDSVVRIESSQQQMSFITPVTVNPDAELHLLGHGLAVGSLTMIGNSTVYSYGGSPPLTLLGNLSAQPIGGNSAHIQSDLSLGGADRTIDVGSGYFDIQGAISSGGGNAGIIKAGWGGLVLSGNNTYTGATTVNEGDVYVDGNQVASPIVVHSLSLSGWGAAGTITCQGGEFYPYPNPGTRNMTSKDLTLDSASIFGVTLKDYQVPASPAFLTVTGAVNLGNCKFYGVFNTNSTFNPAIGTQFLVIQNDGNDAVTGTFVGMPEGAKFNFGGRQWQITYKGGTGNDVALSLLSAQLPLSTDSLFIDKAGGWTHVYGTGTPGVSYELHASTNLVNWTKVDDANNDNGSLEGYDNHWYHGAPQCFYRFYKP